MANKKSNLIQIKENNLVELINNIVEATIKERNLVPASKAQVKKPTVKKMTVTESQLRELQKKGAKINSIVKKKG